MIRDTLLVIDDSELDLAILNEIFKKLFQVQCVSDARQAKLFLREEQDRVCAILLDICLERRGVGFTVLHQLQEDPSTATLPVILITTDANEKDVKTSVERGAVDFLVKPVDPHTVQERVCSVVRNAWPAGSTILDHKREAKLSSTMEQPQARFFPKGLTLEEAQAFCEAWIGKLEAFCALRPVLNMSRYRQLGTITTLLAQRFAKAFPQKGLTQDDAALVGLAAMFCDVGLLGLPDHVIKAGSESHDLDDPDVQLYFQHSQLGHDLLSREGEELPLFRHASQTALWHHKNADGSGFPFDKPGEATPISGQLVHTALLIQRYLEYYRGCTDGIDRTLRTLKGEIGVTISQEMYQTAESAREGLLNMMQTS